ncbi:MAG: phosphate acetyltransferase [Deltaproteobacteria bacterium]|jgi:phosphate acetyltransferase|nr:phosphate acetyltransferase [Deltaproteobacteria bacterium]
MAKNVFLASTDQAADKTALAKAFINSCPCQGGKPGYFQTLTDNPDNPKFAELASLLGKTPRDLYGLTIAEAVDLLNSGQKAVLIEEILGRYARLASQFEAVIIEGGDPNPLAAFELQGLGAELAANLAAPVLLLSGGDLALAASGVRVFKDRQAEILGLVLVDGANAAEAAKVEVLKGVDIQSVKASELAQLPAQWCPKIQAYETKVVTPKRFEYNLIERAKANKKKIVLPEGDDDRVLLAADDILRRQFADIVILGDVAAIKAKAAELGLKHLDKAELVDIKTASFRQELVDQFYELRKAKGVTPEKADAQLHDRNWFATMMVKAKKADGMVSGAAGTTADTIRPALSIIKTKPGCSIASSVFLMCMKDKVLVFGDCAINTNPTPQQLAEIAVISAQTGQAFGVDPKVAMLSYSTGTSGAGPDVDAIHEATKLAQESAAQHFPGLPLDGPMQFDAALDPKTAKGKMPNSKVAGQATVLVFPSLNAGNIGYKAVQRTSGAVAVGPIIQGLNAPVNDLSRGCTVPDIINTVAITAVQAQ